MAFEVHPREVDSVTILDLHGRLVAGSESAALRDHILSLRTDGITKLILNLKEVHYIDSTGLGALVSAHSTLRDAGGAMKLMHLTKRSSDLMVLTKLTTVFEIFDDEQAALNSFFPDRKVPDFDILEFVQSQDEKPVHLGADAEKAWEPESSES